MAGLIPIARRSGHQLRPHGSFLRVYRGSRTARCSIGGREWAVGRRAAARARRVRVGERSPRATQTLHDDRVAMNTRLVVVPSSHSASAAV